MPIDKSEYSAIEALFKDGKSQTEIADRYSVSRQAISRILLLMGVDYSHGGQSVKVARKRRRAQEERDRKCIERFGCTREQFREANKNLTSNGRTPIQAFEQQKRHAERRGVSWKMKFWDWWNVWELSGKWCERGRGKNLYCMCRIGDTGPYSAENVYIGTVRHNSRLGKTLSLEKPKPKTKVARVLVAAGGNSVVAEKIGVSAVYLAQLANCGEIPQEWFRDGRAEILCCMASPAFSMEEIRELAYEGAPKEGRAA